MLDKPEKPESEPVATDPEMPADHELTIDQAKAEVVEGTNSDQNRGIDANGNPYILASGGRGRYLTKAQGLVHFSPKFSENRQSPNPPKISDIREEFSENRHLVWRALFLLWPYQTNGGVRPPPRNRLWQDICGVSIGALKRANPTYKSTVELSVRVHIRVRDYLIARITAYTAMVAELNAAIDKRSTDKQTTLENLAQARQARCGIRPRRGRPKAVATAQTGSSPGSELPGLPTKPPVDNKS